MLLFAVYLTQANDETATLQAKVKSLESKNAMLNMDLFQMRERCEAAESKVLLLGHDISMNELLKDQAKKDGVAVAAARNDVLVNDDFYFQQLAVATATIDDLQAEVVSLRAELAQVMI
jgi:chromosome segregation ATPase